MNVALRWTRNSALVLLVLVAIAVLVFMWLWQQRQSIDDIGSQYRCRRFRTDRRRIPSSQSCAGIGFDGANRLCTGQLLCAVGGAPRPVHNRLAHSSGSSFMVHSALPARNCSASTYTASPLHRQPISVPPLPHRSSPHSIVPVLCRYRF